MSAPKDGGPAFPKQPIWKTPDGFSIEMEQPGMSLRDYMAAKAMQAALTGATAGSEENIGPMFKMLARISYQMADAMLAAREVKP